MKLSGARGVVLTKLAVTAGLIALIAMVAPVASSATTSRVPGAARSVHASLIRSTAVVRWRAPASDGGSPITRYRAVSHPSGLSCMTEGTTCDIAQLKNKTTYRFTVEALNRYGNGRVSSLSNAVTVNTQITVVVVPPAPPSPPTTTTTVPSGGGSGGGGGGGGGSPPPTSYTVTFSANGGTGSMPAETESSSTALTSNGFANAGYSFSGWNTLANGTGMTYANDATYSFSSSITLYAQWTALPSFTVTFNSNGGTGSMSAETENVATALTSNAFARTGYTFAGWSTTANGSLAYANDATYPFTASVTLYALWAQDFTVTFNANGGAGSMSAETDSSPTALESNTFAYAGHTFTDWNTAANGSGTPYANDATYPFAASVILYAQWATDYTVTFNANGGTGSMSAETDSSPTPLTSNAFANAGDAFNGWNTAADGSGTAYANDATYAFAASVTLYAQWTVNSAPSITLQPASQVLESGRTATFTASATGTPTPSVQWNVSINDGSSWSVITGATSATYSVTITPFDNGYEYEAIFTNVNGSATTTAAQLTVATTSSNWSGYVDTGGTFSAVSAKWIVPTVTCTTGSLTAVQWVGIDGYGSSTVEQDGTETSCNGTTASYYAWYEMYGDASVNNGYLSPLSTSTYPVTPGNVMSASVSYAAGEWTLSVANTTVGWTFSIGIASPTPPPAQVSAEWIAEDPDECSGSCTMATLADFGSVTFTNASVTSNGVTGSITSSTVAAIDEIDSSNIVMSAPGPLSGGGTSFTDTWESST